MSQLAGMLSVVLAYASPAIAQDAAPGADTDAPSRMEQGLDRLGEGAWLFLEGLSDEVRPQLDMLLREVEPTLRGMIAEMGPALNELAELIGDLNAYHPPERLPNGDILLRRKSPPPPDTPDPATPQPEPEGPVDL